jgi:hypothetical protein
MATAQHTSTYIRTSTHPHIHGQCGQDVRVFEVLRDLRLSDGDGAPRRVHDLESDMSAVQGEEAKRDVEMSRRRAKAAVLDVVRGVDMPGERG